MATKDTACPVRVLVVERSEVVRSGVCNTLAVDPEIEIAAEIARLEEAPEAHRKLNPRVTLLGLSRELNEEGNSLTRIALREILRSDPQAHVVVIGASDQDYDLLMSVACRAHGALLIDMPGDMLRKAVLSVAAGDCVMDPRLTSHFFAQVSRVALSDGNGFASSDAKHELKRPLSIRELQVLRGISDGLSNKEIAVHLGVSTGTVKTHISHIFEKLQVQDRTSAAIMALKRRLFDAA